MQRARHKNLDIGSRAKQDRREVEREKSQIVPKDRSKSEKLSGTPEKFTVIIFYLPKDLLATAQN